MWIKGQNRDVLVNANDICFHKLNIHSEIIYQFRCYGYGDDYYILGEYSTQEKAMKVMDMIQSSIIHKEENLLHSQYQEPIILNTNDIVFQMPTDDEVEVWQQKKESSKVKQAERKSKRFEYSMKKSGLKSIECLKNIRQMIDECLDDVKE